MHRFACPTPDFRGRYRCIDDRQLCNGFFDCPGREDENPEQCLFYKTVIEINLGPQTEINFHFNLTDKVPPGHPRRGAPQVGKGLNREEGFLQEILLRCCSEERPRSASLLPPPPPPPLHLIFWTAMNSMWRRSILSGRGSIITQQRRHGIAYCEQEPFVCPLKVP